MSRRGMRRWIGPVVAKGWVNMPAIQHSSRKSGRVEWKGDERATARKSARCCAARETLSVADTAGVGRVSRFA